MTTPAGSAADCRIASDELPPVSVVEAYAYDYRSRLVSFRRFASGAATDSASYRYDAFDRLAEQTERHPGEEQRTTSFAYVGASDTISGESSAQAGATIRKSYGCDAFGARLQLERTAPGGSPERYSYGQNTHGDVSLLVGQAGTARAAYGYRAYGDQDPGLTKGDSSERNPRGCPGRR